MKRLIFCLLLVLLAISVSAQQYIEETGDTLRIYENPRKIDFKLSPNLFTFVVGDPIYGSGTDVQIRFSISLAPSVTVDPSVAGVERFCISTENDPVNCIPGALRWVDGGIKKVNIYSYPSNTKYYYRPVLIIGDQTIYGPTKSFYTTRYVDLGLSVYWAAMNVGAREPEDIGGYYAWGETKPHASQSYGTNDYAYFQRTPTFADILYSTKYDNNDKKTILEQSDDAAYVNKGKPWRMPTLSEVQELVKNCNIEYQSDKKLYKFTSKINGNSIYFPATGYSGGDQETLYIWTSQLYEDYYRGYGEAAVATGSAFYAYYLSVNKYNNVNISHTWRYEGLAIRPVYPK